MDDTFGKRVGGRLCLDFVNTVSGRVGRAAPGRARDYADRVLGERLDSYDALLRWASLDGVVTAGEARALARESLARPADAAVVLDRSVRLREAMYRLFKAAVEGWSPDRADLEAVNRELRVARGNESLVATPRFELRWNRSRSSLDRVLWPVVRSAVELLASEEVERVGQCPGEECGWLFLDTSRSRRRRWCDMADCGNRAKVRRYRERGDRAS